MSAADPAAVAQEALAERLNRLNDEAHGRDCDDLEFRVAKHLPGQADIAFREDGMWVARIPEDAASLAVLDAVASAVRSGRALGRAEGKREIGYYLRRECGL